MFALPKQVEPSAVTPTATGAAGIIVRSNNRGGWRFAYTVTLAAATLSKRSRYPRTQTPTPPSSPPARRCNWSPAFVTSRELTGGCALAGRRSYFTFLRGEPSNLPAANTSHLRPPLSLLISNTRMPPSPAPDPHHLPPVEMLGGGSGIMWCYVTKPLPAQRQGQRQLTSHLCPP